MIRQTNLKSDHVYTDSSPLTYTVTREPKVGTVYLEKAGSHLPIADKGPVTDFTQTDIDQGKIYISVFSVECQYLQLH